MADRKDPDHARAERSGRGAAKWIIVIIIAIIVVILLAMGFGGLSGTSTTVVPEVSG